MPRKVFIVQIGLVSSMNPYWDLTKLIWFIDLIFSQIYLGNHVDYDVCSLRFIWCIVVITEQPIDVPMPLSWLAVRMPLGLNNALIIQWLGFLFCFENLCIIKVSSKELILFIFYRSDLYSLLAVLILRIGNSS